MIVIDQQLKTEIERILNAGNRVELIPTKDGVKALKIRREQVKTVARP